MHPKNKQKKRKDVNKLEYSQRKKQQETAGRLILRDNRRNDGCLTQRADDMRDEIGRGLGSHPQTSEGLAFKRPLI